MNPLHRPALTLIVSLLLTACGSFLPSEKPPRGIDGVACVGDVGTLPAEFSAARNDLLLKAAQGVSGKGGICAGAVFSAQQNIQLFRVWDSSRPQSQYGQWWALEKPVGPEESYRQAYAICHAWSALDRLLICKLKPGTQIVIGTTQSADCDDGSYPKSANLQLYLQGAAATAGSSSVVESCTDAGPWP